MARSAPWPGDVDGVMMDLPSGYTLNSVAWGVVNDVLTGTAAVRPEPTPTELSWGPVTPNPGSGSMTLSYALPRRGQVSIEILDVQGRAVRSLAIGAEEAGTHRVDWDGRDTGGGPVAAGLYFARLRLDQQEVTCRMTRLR
jgi:hypothetical protein